MADSGPEEPTSPVSTASEASSVAVPSGAASGAGGAGDSGAGAGAGTGDESTKGAASSAVSGDAARAEELKTKGNEQFSAGHFAQAADMYSQAIEAQPSAVLYSNRAACHLKLEAFGSAINDANEAISLDADYLKAYYRRASANMALSKFKPAVADFLLVCKRRPKDRDARAKYNEAVKAKKRQAFEAAIASDHGRPPSETIDPEAIVVPDSYRGPHMPPPSELTLDFVKAAMEEFKSQKLIHKKYVVQLLIHMKKVFSETPTLMNIPVPATFEDGSPGKFSVCGDTHGQFYDLMNIFSINGLPSPTNPYLFNGDFVDRGSFSVEVALTMFLLKALYPTGLYLTRGNHETKNMNKMYGFEGEVKAKYDMSVMELFAEVFNELPLCAVISKKVFVVHGGLFQRDDVTLDEIAALKRGREPPDTGLISDMLWSDPQPFRGRGPSKRGVGQSFGPDITASFLERNGLELLIRSHEVKDEGYLVEHDGKCITVFSAPNYCDQMGNKGAIVKFGPDMKPSFVKFEHVPHPPVRPMAYAGNMFGL